MASAASSPTARRWELAARLRALREAAGKSIEDAATELMCSPAKISRMETGGRGIQPRDIRDLCRFYGLPEAVRDELLALNAEARKPGWWNDLRTIDEQTKTFVGLEAAATEIRQVETHLVGGLVQTSEVTRALLAGLRVPGELHADWVEETIDLRTRRQKRLMDGELSYGLLIDELALVRLERLVDLKVWRGQIARFLEVADLPTASVQILPTDQVHPGLDGSFQLLKGPFPNVGYFERLIGNTFVDDAAQFDRLENTYEFMQGTVALDVERSRSWLQARLRASRQRRSSA